MWGEEPESAQMQNDPLQLQTMAAERTRDADRLRPSICWRRRRRQYLAPFAQIGDLPWGLRIETTSEIP